MELDSIIYIVIAIVLAVVNAIAQKKKKRDAAQPAVDIMDGEEEMDYQEQETDYYPTNEKPKASKGVEDFFKEFTEAFADEEPEASPSYPEPDTSQQEMQAKAEELIAKTEAEAATAQQKEQASSEALSKSSYAVEEADISDYIDEYDYNTDKNSISSLAKADALRGGKNAKRSTSAILKDFSGKKAIIFSEIITPKYF